MPVLDHGLEHVGISYGCPRCKAPLFVEGSTVVDTKRPGRHRLRTIVPKHEYQDRPCPASGRGHTLTPKSTQVWRPA
jgi:hypothetical protein